MEIKKSVYKVSGMSCTSCAARLQNAISRLNGVQECSVNFAAETVLIKFDPSLSSEEDLFAIAKNTGYPLHKDLTYDNKEENSKLLKKVILSWVLTIFVIVIWFFKHFANTAIDGVISPLLLNVINIIFSGLVLFVAGQDTFKNAISSTKSMDLGMDVLIALGAFAAWITALLPFVGIGIQDYSMTAAMLISVNLTGHFLEHLARGKASEAVTKLANFGSETAFKLLESGETKEVNISELKIGDHILVKNSF